MVDRKMATRIAAVRKRMAKYGKAGQRRFRLERQRTIREARELGFSISQVAERMGIRRTQVIAWEKEDLEED